MAWVRLDDGFPEHPKIVKAGAAAAYLFICGLAYANRYLTDGFLPRGICQKYAGGSGSRLARALVDAGLWEAADGGYMIHDFLDYQPAASEVKYGRTMHRTRRELYSDGALTAEVKQRDGGRCRYCGRVVAWRDRKGPGGGTYDHVIPSGGNSLDNLVVACRACNSRKGRRTPDEAGMRLLDLPEIQSESAGDLPEIYPESVGNLLTRSRSRSRSLETSKPGPEPLLPDAAVAAGADSKSVSVLVNLSEGGREAVEFWRAAHGKRKPPKLNPTQIAKLEKAVTEVGLEWLQVGATWSAERGIPEFDKAINAAYTARQNGERTNGNAATGSAAGGAWNGAGRPAAGSGPGSAGRAKRFAQYVLRDPATG